MKSLYLIGSLRNPQVPVLARKIRKLGFDVFDDWYAAGKIADDSWRDYEIARGHNFAQALQGRAARNVYEFDKKNLDRCDIAVMLMKAGKSGHLELGYFLGSKKPGYILMDKIPARFDVMYQFSNGVFFSERELFNQLKKEK